MEKNNGQDVTTEEVIRSLAFQLEAIIHLLEEKKVLTREEVLEKIRVLLTEKQRPQ